jgi:hypothetical protein
VSFGSPFSAATTTFNYDPSHGYLLSKSVTDGTHTRTWTYTYNSQGQVPTAKAKNPMRV